MHRIGRTGRAGSDGIAISFCSDEERELFYNIEQLTNKRIPIIEEHPFVQEVAAYSQPERRSYPPRPQQIQSNKRRNYSSNRRQR